MSRDAKVGLVIIFSFVFLLGTILLHRLHWISADSTSEFNEPVVSESDSESAIVDSGQRYQVGDDAVPSSAVDAVPADTVAARAQPDLRLRDPAFGDGQKSHRQSNSARPPAELPASQSNGALISLTERETYQQPTTQQRAAVVESNSAAKRSAQHNSGGVNGVAADNATNRASPLLEIHSPDRESDQESVTSEEEQSIQTFNTRGERANKEVVATPFDGDRGSDVHLFAKQTATDDEGDDTSEPSRAAVDEESVESRTADNRRISFETVTASPDRADNDNARSAAGHLQAPFEWDESEQIQQTEGKRQVGREFESPPKLPKYGEPPQATIESVPAHSGRVDQSETNSPGAASGRPASRSTPSKPISADDSTFAEDTSNTAPRAYVVKDGDSFWTISAKQYGTGKYFRALEEFNRHRLAAYEDGVRILRPGTEILLPSVAVLQAKGSSPKLSGTAGTPVALGDGFKARRAIERAPEQGSQDVARQTNASGGRGGTSRVYRVKDGDSLSKIAQRELGTSKRWQEIYELNADKLEGQDVLKVGMELKLPGDRPVEKLVERPFDGR
jgi:nucleoid-associated protein YgaU